jgi:AraC family ethanolamine operon transcriptional activator
MTRFEELLAGNPALPIPMSKLCKALGVSDRSLRTWCDAFLGMSPNKYLRLRRMHAAHCGLRHADSMTCTVAEVARRNGFRQLGRFAGDYCAVFGEMPSATLYRH